MATLKMDKKKHPLFLILHPRYVETISDERNWSLIEYTKHLVCRFFSNPCESPTACHNATKKPTATPSQKNKLQSTISNLKKTTAPWSTPACRPSVAPIFKVSDIAVWCAFEIDLRNTTCNFSTCNLLILYFICYYSIGTDSARMLTKYEFFLRIFAHFSCSLRQNDAH